MFNNGSCSSLPSCYDMTARPQTSPPRRFYLASVKEGIIHPHLPTLRRMNMDNQSQKLPEEHSRTSTCLSREDFRQGNIQLNRASSAKCFYAVQPREISKGSADRDIYFARRRWLAHASNYANGERRNTPMLWGAREINNGSFTKPHEQQPSFAPLPVSWKMNSSYVTENPFQNNQKHRSNLSNRGFNCVPMFSLTGSNVSKSFSFV